MKKKIFIFVLSLFLCLTLTGCGDNSSSGTGGNKEFKGNYEFNPPRNNYYVKTKDTDDDVVITARIDKLYTVF